MTERTGVTGMKYCGDCVCFDIEKKFCRAYGNTADAKNTACITPGGKIEVDYNIYPALHKCTDCKNPCNKRIEL